MGVIFDDEATVIKSVESKKGKKLENQNKRNLSKKSKMNVKMIKASEAIEAIASYLPTHLSILDGDAEKGKCVICKKETSNIMRKICYDCMIAHRENIVKKLIEDVVEHEIQID